MAMVKFLTSELVNVGPNGLFSCLLIGARPTPSKVVDVASVAGIEVALDAFAAELKDTGRALVVTTHIMKGFRKPAGFDKAQHKLRRFVNEELVRKTEAA